MNNDPQLDPEYGTHSGSAKGMPKWLAFVHLVLPAAILVLGLVSVSADNVSKPKSLTESYLEAAYRI